VYRAKSDELLEADEFELGEEYDTAAAAAVEGWCVSSQISTFSFALTSPSSNGRRLRVRVCASSEEDVYF
jgi:hypothetical protein